MHNRWIVTPYALGARYPEMERLSGAEGTVNRVALDEADQIARMASVHAALGSSVETAVRGGDRPVAAVGDCCQTIGVLAGLQRAGLDPIVVWLDAHGDFNTGETTVTGFLGGMPLAMIAGHGDQTLTRGAGLRPCAEADIFLSDARDLDPAERALLARSRVHRPSIASLADAVPAGRPIYVHFDVDVLDPSDAPALHYIVPGGSPVADVQAMMSALAATGRVAAVSMAVWDLAADADRRTERMCLDVLHGLIGRE